MSDAAPSGSGKGSRFARVNVFCERRGWLFDDLWEFYRRAGAHCTREPDPDADLWLCIRSGEIARIPDLSRAVIQIHSMAPHNLPEMAGAAALIFTHPMQFVAYRAKGFSGRQLTLPIGTREAVVPTGQLPPRPTLGFFCGEPAPPRSGQQVFVKGSDLLERVVRAARRSLDFDLLLMGRHLDHVAHLGTYRRDAAGPADYARVDALFCASMSPGIPLSVYEACAAGLPVVTTPRWFPDGPWPTILTAADEADLVEAVLSVLRDREAFAAGRASAARRPYVLEDWIHRTLQFSLQQVLREGTRVPP